MTALHLTYGTTDDGDLYIECAIPDCGDEFTGVDGSPEHVAWVAHHETGVCCRECAGSGEQRRWLDDDSAPSPDAYRCSCVDVIELGPRVASVTPDCAERC